MLVLSRKAGEKILLGDNIVITVVRVANGAVRIGIEAPPELPVLREEIRVQRIEPGFQEKTSADRAPPR